MIEKPENRMPASQVSATWRIDWRGARFAFAGFAIADFAFADFAVAVFAAADFCVADFCAARSAFVVPGLVRSGREGRRAAFIVLLTSWKRPTGAASGHPRRASQVRVTP
ncbi:hypothetical protein GCM10009573_22550 [Agromyces bracchium]